VSVSDLILGVGRLQMTKQQASGVPLPLESAAEDYLSYVKALEKEYSDVLEVRVSRTQGLHCVSQLRTTYCHAVHEPRHHRQSNVWRHYPKTSVLSTLYGARGGAELTRAVGAAATQEATAGTLMVWGTGDMGQLGLGEDIQEKGRPFPLPLGAPVLHVACGGMHTLAVTSTGHVFSWGVNDEGALGRAVPYPHPRPPAEASGCIRGWGGGEQR
jgi:hypothetical protein